MAKSKFKIFKLKKTKTQGGFQLPLTNVLLERYVDGESVGHRKIKYVPGTKSIWEEDLSGDLKPVEIWFENGKCIVPLADKNKIKILESHPWLDKHYELFDKEAQAVKELEAYKTKAEALKLVDEADINKLKAISIAFFGSHALNWESSSCELELRKFAEANPSKLIQEMKTKEYESKYIAALSFAKNIVGYGMGKTNLVWKDSTNGEIMKISKGENGISALANFLSKNTEGSLVLIQDISEKIKKLEIDLPKDESVNTVISKKDLEIAELKRQLADKTNSDLSPQEEEEKLIVARSKYIDLYDKKVANAYKNNLEWIEEKIKAKQEYSEL